MKIWPTNQAHSTRTPGERLCAPDAVWKKTVNGTVSARITRGVRRIRCWLLGGLTALAAGTAPSFKQDLSGNKELLPGHQAAIALSGIPLHFEAQPGTADATAYLARGNGFALQLESRQLNLVLRRFGRGNSTSPPKKRKQETVRMRWLNANPGSIPMGQKPAATRMDRFIGSDPDQWKTGVASYASVRYPALYPAIDLVCYGTGAALEYDFIVAPGGEPEAIRFSLEGARKLSLDRDGDLLIQGQEAEFRQRRPLVYQEREGRRVYIPGRFALSWNAGRPEPVVGFEVGEYDRTRPLIIDPVLDFSSYFGGNAGDQINDVAVTTDGNLLYLAGTTSSPDFPTANPVHPSLQGGTDIFISVVELRRRRLVYSAYIGGSGDDSAGGIAIDRAGSIYLAGTTTSNNFPPVSQIQRTLSGTSDAVLVKLSTTRQGPDALVFSTYLGGAGSEQGSAVAVLPERSDLAYLCGSTTSVENASTLEKEGFPVTAGAFQAVAGGNSDAFVALVDQLDPEKPVRARLAYSTYLGGAGNDFGLALALTSQGQACVAGAAGAGFPTTTGAYQTTHAGGAADAFAAILDPSVAGANSRIYASLLGTEKEEEARGIAVDTAQRLYLTGTADPISFPVVRAFAEIPPGGMRDAFVARLEPRVPGTAGLTYCTCLGGSGEDAGNAIRVQEARVAAEGVLIFAAGDTTSPDLRATNAVAAYAGGSDAFAVAVQLSPMLNPRLIYYTYFGGDSDEDRTRLALDAGGGVLLAGRTLSADNPATQADEALPLVDPLQGFPRGSSDGFLARIELDGEGRLNVSPHRVRFPRVRPGSSSGKRIRIRNRGRGALEVTVGNPVAPFRIRGGPIGAPFYLQPKESREIDLRFEPPAVGAYQGTLVITGNRPGQNAVTLKLSGKSP